MTTLSNIQQVKFYILFLIFSICIVLDSCKNADITDSEGFAVKKLGYGVNEVIIKKYRDHIDTLMLFQFDTAQAGITFKISRLMRSIGFDCSISKPMGFYHGIGLNYVITENEMDVQPKVLKEARNPDVVVYRNYRLSSNKTNLSGYANYVYSKGSPQLVVDMITNENRYKFMASLFKDKLIKYYTPGVEFYVQTSISNGNGLKHATFKLL